MKTDKDGWNEFTDETPKEILRWIADNYENNDIECEVNTPFGEWEKYIMPCGYNKVLIKPLLFHHNELDIKLFRFRTKQKEVCHDFGCKYYNPTMDMNCSASENECERCNFGKNRKTYRPFKDYEEFKPHRERWVTRSLHIPRPAWHCERSHTYKDMVDNYRFEDTGEPCGVKE